MPCASEKAFVSVNSGVWECGDRALAVKMGSYARTAACEIAHESRRSQTRSYDWTAACENPEQERKCDRMRERRCGEMMPGWKSWENAIGWENSGVCECWERAKSEKCILIKEDRRARMPRAKAEEMRSDARTAACEYRERKVREIASLCEKSSAPEC